MSGRHEAYVSGRCVQGYGSRTDSEVDPKPVSVQLRRELGAIPYGEQVGRLSPSESAPRATEPDAGSLRRLDRIQSAMDCNVNGDGPGNEQVQRQAAPDEKPHEAKQPANAQIDKAAAVVAGPVPDGVRAEMARMLAEARNGVMAAAGRGKWDPTARLALMDAGVIDALVKQAWSDAFWAAASACAQNKPKREVFLAAVDKLRAPLAAIQSKHGVHPGCELVADMLAQLFERLNAGIDVEHAKDRVTDPGSVHNAIVSHDADAAIVHGDDVYAEDLQSVPTERVVVTPEDLQQFHGEIQALMPALREEVNREVDAAPPGSDEERQGVVRSSGAAATQVDAGAAAAGDAGVEVDIAEPEGEPAIERVTASEVLGNAAVPVPLLREVEAQRPGTGAHLARTALQELSQRRLAGRSDVIKQAAECVRAQLVERAAQARAKPRIKGMLDARTQSMREDQGPAPETAPPTD